MQGGYCRGVPVAVATLEDFIAAVSNAHEAVGAPTGTIDQGIAHALTTAVLRTPSECCTDVRHVWMKVSPVHTTSGIILRPDTRDASLYGHSLGAVEDQMRRAAA